MKNGLFNLQGEWKGDGSKDSNIEVTGSIPGVVAFSGKSRGSPFSICYSAPGLSGKPTYYFESKVVSLERNHSLSVGLVSEDMLRPGYQVRGMFYNGNLTNGSSALVVGFGDYIKEGSVIGILCELQSSLLRVSIVMNGSNLGFAFEIPNDGKSVYYPCLHVNGTATVQVSFPEETPVKSYNPSSSESKDKYVGNWKLQRLALGPELGEKSLSDVDVVGKLEPDGEGSYTMSLKVGNRSLFTISVLDFEEGFHNVTVQAGMSTKMLSPPPIQSIEDAVFRSLPTVNRMSSDQSRLMFVGSAVELEFIPRAIVRDPLKSFA